MKPKIFVGSSTENIEVAEAIHCNLDYFGEITPWFSGVFGLSVAAWESLARTLVRYDYAVLVLTPDDELNIRGSKKQAPRDNMIYELGLYTGAFGLNRCFGVIPRDNTNLQLPTDLAGITFATYESNRSDNNLKAALVPACSAIKDAIKLDMHDEDSQFKNSA